jgi:predicted TIM-barrel fold metal-dependent hydrolase
MSPARALQPSTPVNFDVPAGACDCHTHIFGESDRFPFFAGRIYTPPPALPDEMSALHRGLHVERVVIVTPSVYGTDNSATLYSMKARGPSARGVAVIDEKTPESELEALHAAGVRGIRLAFATQVLTDPTPARKSLQSTIDRVKIYGWHVQLLSELKVYVALKDQFAAAPVTFVFDHFAGAQAALGLEQPGLADILDLVSAGKAYIKISGAYRASKKGPDYADVTPLAQACIAANPDRIVWGTDWPHPNAVNPPGMKPTDINPNLPIDDAIILNQLPIWAPDAAIREKILVTNPATLYGF